MTAPQIVLNVIFYVLAAAAIAGAVAVAASKNIVRSAFALLVVLFSAAGLYAVMKADFIAAAQVLIYVGGILVLIIFAVMLTHKITDVKLSNESTPGPAAFCACLCLLFSLVVVILFTAKWQRDSEPVRVSAGDTEVFLDQYQSDGTTGLARGSHAFDQSVVLVVRAPRPINKVSYVDFTAVSTRDTSGNERVITDVSGNKVPKPIVHKTSTPVKEGDEVTVAKFDNLDEGEWRWTARLRGVDWTGPEATSSTGKPDFVVYRGITEPIAMALAGPYLLAFEVVSVLLLAALVGAAFLARKEVKE